MPPLAGLKGTKETAFTGSIMINMHTPGKEPEAPRDIQKLSSSNPCSRRLQLTPAARRRRSREGGTIVGQDGRGRGPGAAPIHPGGGCRVGLYQLH